jgi:hypothetical protein
MVDGTASPECLFAGGVVDLIGADNDIEMLMGVVH